MAVSVEKFKLDSTVLPGVCRLIRYRNYNAQTRTCQTLSSCEEASQTPTKSTLSAKEQVEESGDGDRRSMVAGQSKPVYDPKYLAVDVHKKDNMVPVQAHVVTHFVEHTPQVHFTVRKGDGRDSKMGFSVRTVRDQKDIVFHQEFVNGSIEDIQEEFYSRFRSRGCTRKSSRHLQMFSAPCVIEER